MAVVRSPFSSNDEERDVTQPTVAQRPQPSGKLSAGFFDYSKPTELEQATTAKVSDYAGDKRRLYDEYYANLERLAKEDPNNFASASGALYQLTQAEQEPSAWQKVLGTALKPFNIGQRAVSATVGTIGAGLEQAARYATGQGMSPQQALASATAAANLPNAPTPEPTGTPIATKLISVSRPDLQEQIEAGYMPSWEELFSDEALHVTVPNIRDKVSTGDIPVLSPIFRAGLWTMDAAIELGAQSAVDPLSYVSFGAGKWAGQAGRAALASRLLQKDAIRVIDDAVRAGLVGAIDYGKIYRFGEWGLTGQQRKLLANAGIIEHAGISLNFGSQSTIRGTGLLSNTIGRAATYGRYGAGRLLKPTDNIADFFTSKSLRSLTPVATGRATSGEARTALAHYAASLSAKAEYGKIGSLLGSRYYKLIKELSENPDSNVIYRAIENDAVAAIPDDATRTLAQQLETAFKDIKDQYNASIDRLISEYGLEPDFVYKIADVDNYFFHTITPQAARWMRKNGDKPEFVSSLVASFDASPSDMKRGVGPLRARKLVADGETEWFGVKLQTGTLDEINGIFRDKAKVDFDWFETDSASVLASYIDSAASNYRRIAYVDKLFEHGDDVIRKILPKYVKDEVAINAVESSLKGLRSERNSLIRRITNVASGKVSGNKRTAVTETRALGQRLAKAIDDNTAVLVDSEDDVARLTAQLGVLNQRLADAQSQLSKNKSKAQREFDIAIVPLQAQIDALKSAVDKGTARREAARQALIQEHVKLFPRRRNRPADIKELAAEITGSKAKRFGQKLRALETRQRRAERRAGKASSALEQARLQEEDLLTAQTDIGVRRQVLSELRDINYDAEIFPDGIMYTSREHLSTTPDQGTAYFFDSYDDVVDAIAIPAPDVEGTFDIALRLDDIQEILVDFPNAVANNLVARTGDEQLGEWVRTETSRLLTQPLGTEVDSRVPAELHGIIGTISGWGWSKETSEETVSVFLDELSEQVNSILSVKSIEPFDPEDGMLVIEDSLRAAAQAARPEEPRVTVVLPDIQYGEGNRMLVSSTEAWNIYSGQTDSVFAGIEQGTQIWDDVVPERAPVVAPEPAVLPSKATKAAEPTVAPTTVFKSTDGASREQSKQIVTTMFSTPSSSKERNEYLSGLLAEVRALRNDVGDVAEADLVSQLKDNPAAKQYVSKFRELQRKIKAVTDVREQAFLLNVAYREPNLLVADLIEDEFGSAVEFTIGMSAAGVDTPLSRTMGNYGFDEELVPFIRGAAYSASVAKPQNYARITKAERAKLMGAAEQGATQMEPSINIVEPTVRATRPERGQVVSSPLDREMAIADELQQIIEQRKAVGATRETAELEAGLARQEVGDVGRQIGGLKGGQRRAEQAMQRRVEQATDKTIERQNVAGIKRIRTEAQARDKLGELRPKLNTEERKLRNAMNNDPLVGDIKDVEKQIKQTALDMDTANAVSVEANTWDTQVRPEYQEKIDRIVQLTNYAPTAGYSAEATKAWFDELQNLLSQINDPKILNNKQRNVYDRVFTQKYALEADLAQLDFKIDDLEQFLGELNTTQFAKVTQDILDGWEAFYGMGVQVPKEIMDEWTRGMKGLTDPTKWNELMRGYAIYTRFFKAWAIATPGFTVRNAMTAAFNNAVAGVGFENQKIAVEFAGRLARIRTANTDRGGLEYALDWAEKKYGREVRNELEQAYEAVMVSGGGQSIDEVFRLAKLPVTAGKRQRAFNKLYNNAITRGQQRINEGVEIGARMAMALDGVRQGWSLEQNAARIRRYHFDYSDLSQFDMYAKAIIPFWTFASRNMQVQIINMITRPAMYRGYERVKEMGADVDTILPEWVQNRSPIMLGARTLLMPDLPMVGLEEQAKQLGAGGVSRIVAQANPLIRSIIEGVSGESAMFGSNLRAPVEGATGVTDMPAQVLQNITRLWRGEDPTYNKYWQELLPSLLPPLQQLQRYIQPTLGAMGATGAQDFVGGTERYKTRDFMTTIANYLGIPYRKLTDAELEKAIDSRIYEMNSIVREADDETLTWQELVRQSKGQ